MQQVPDTQAAVRSPDTLWSLTHSHLSLVLKSRHRTLLPSGSSLDLTLSLASLSGMPLWINIVVIILLGNASASTEWCRRQFQSPHNWTCLAAESSFPTCCPPGSICLKNICSPTPSGSSDLPEMTPSDWYAPCFYPNGDIEPKDMPCSSQGGACCPGRWQCLSNGLCYNEFRYERHTCTDHAWGPSCPQVCETDLGKHVYLINLQLVLTSKREHCGCIRGHFDVRHQ